MSKDKLKLAADDSAFSCSGARLVSAGSNGFTRVQTSVQTLVRQGSGPGTDRVQTGVKQTPLFELRVYFRSQTRHERAGKAGRRAEV